MQKLIKKYEEHYDAIFIGVFGTKYVFDDSFTRNSFTQKELKKEVTRIEKEQ